MRRYSQRSSHGALAEINVTPLLDLAFVLLIIFIITTPLMVGRIDLMIPSSTVSRDIAERDKPVVISVDRQRALALDDEPVDLETLTRRLTQARAARPQLAVVVQAHRDLPVQDLVDVMDALTRAGITRVGILTRRAQ